MCQKRKKKKKTILELFQSDAPVHSFLGNWEAVRGNGGLYIYLPIKVLT